jgi:hypothetical protein
MSLRVVSFGGGVQSTALLVLAAQGEIDFATMLFANVGDDSENPATLDYVRGVAMPYALSHGIELIELRRQWRDGRDWTLLQSLEAPDSRSVNIPVRMANGAPGNRNCTETFKIKVVSGWLKEHGATAQNIATVALGISLDEFSRARSSSGFPHYGITYPLLERRMDRAACQALITRAGLPTPPKSACFFCPMKGVGAWLEMRRAEPELFARSVALERLLNERRAALGKDDIYLSSRMKALDDAIKDDGQLSLLADDACESGYCMT